MLGLRRLKVAGFRAFKEERRFDFDRPAILLFGENHAGKSSTLNAIEWCLFGTKECVGRGTGIRERIGWEVRNRTVRRAEVSVELELEEQDTGDRFIISRRLKSKTKDDLKLAPPDGRLLEGREASERIARLVKSTFTDFKTTVYQHQEAIRAMLTEEPKTRNDAIDRLLGLSDCRNILSGLEDARLPRAQKKMGDGFDGFAAQIETALRTRERDLEETRRKAVQQGVAESNLSERGALEIAAEARTRFQELASEVGLSLPEFDVPKDRKDLVKFKKDAGEQISRFRSEMPDVGKQQEHYERRAEITELKTKYEQSNRTFDSAQSQLEEFVGSSGDEESLEKRKAELEELVQGKVDERKEADARAAAIRDAMDCLRLEKANRDICPVCGRETPNLLDHLEKEWRDKFEKRVGEIEKQMADLRTRLRETEDLHGRSRRLREGVRRARAESGDVTRQIAEALGREIRAGDDPRTILDRELEGVEGELRRLEKAVRSKQAVLDEIDSRLDRMQLVVDILDLEEKRDVVERIKESPEYGKIEGLRDRMAALVDDADGVKEAIEEASHEEAKQKVDDAGELIDAYFRRIARNPSVGRVAFSVSVDSKTRKNSYEFKDQDGRDLTPVLSQGDLNAMALSIFLGMASSAGRDLPLGFVILDDPSQSLGSEHKEGLVEVLNEVLEKRMIVLSTMDRELQELLLSKVTKAKRKYFFSGWTPERGPEVERE